MSRCLDDVAINIELMLFILKWYCCAFIKVLQYFICL